MRISKDTYYFAETKLIFNQYRRNEDELWDEATPVDSGIAAAEQIIKDFDVRTDPEKISMNHPDEVIFGVRTKMMQGPFRGTGNAILTASQLHNERVINRLRHIGSYAPEVYRHIVDEEFLRRTTWQNNKWNWLKSRIGYRKKIENDIAADFFTFNFEGGETYENLRERIQNEIERLDDPKYESTLRRPQQRFLDANNNPIDLSDQNATNEYIVAAGAKNKFRNERVVIRWHEDDFFKIRKKLERARLWGEFSRSTPENRKVRRFIHLKFRLSLLDKVVAEEKTKLNNDRFNAERLQTWLDNDETTQALWDNDMQEFIDTNNIRTNYPDFENLENQNPDLYREFINKLNELKEKNKENTLKYYLSRILPPKELTHLHDSLEARTMLAYLQGATQDPQQGMNIRAYLRKLAGVKEGQTGFSQEKLDETTENIGIINYFHKTYSKENQKRMKLQAEIDKRTRALPRGGKARNTMQKEIDNLQSQLDTLEQELIDKIWDFLTLLIKKQTENGFKDLFNSGISTDENLKNRPTGNLKDFFDAFNAKWGERSFYTNLENTTKILEEQKEDLEKKKTATEEETEPKQMDSRSLLKELIRNDLKYHGVTEPEKLNKHSLFAANLAIARFENSEIYASTNQHIVDEYESVGSVAGNVRGTRDLLSATRFFTPVLSAEDAIEHVVDTDPDLAIFSNITAASTRNDLKDIIDDYGVGPAKIKEFITKLGACIKGIEVSPSGKPLFRKLSYKLGRMFGFAMKNKKSEILGVRLLSSDAILVEELINTLTLLFAEYSAKSYYNEAKEQAEIDSSKSFDEHYLDMISQQTQDMRELNNIIAEDLKDPNNPLKTHLDFYHMRDKAFIALDEVKDITDPEEYEEELKRKGLTIRELTRGVISLRTRRFFRRAARVGLKGLSLPFFIPYGIGLGTRAVGKYWWKEIFMTEGTKKGGKMLKEHWKAVAETPQHIIGIPFFAASMILSWPTRKLREINNKLKN